MTDGQVGQTRRGDGDRGRGDRWHHYSLGADRGREVGYHKVNRTLMELDDNLWVEVTQIAAITASSLNGSETVIYLDSGNRLNSSMSVPDVVERIRMTWAAQAQAEATDASDQTNEEVAE